MSDLDDIYYAIQSGLHSARALESWVNRADARDSVRGDISSLECGLKALERVRAELRDKRKYYEMPEDYKHTSCYCNTPTCSPPCGWCADAKEREREESEDV